MNDPTADERIGVPRSGPEETLRLVSHAETFLDVRRHPDAIFVYLSDFTRHVEWAHTYLAVEPLSTGALRPGARFSVHERQDLHWDKQPLSTIADRDGLDYTTELEATGVTPPSRLAWRGETRGGFLAKEPVITEWEAVIEPAAPDITTLRMRARLGPARALAPWIEELRRRGYPLDVLNRQLDRAMHNLRTILEGRAGKPSTR